MAMLTESGLRKLIKEELRKVLKEELHRPEGLSKLNDFLQKLEPVNSELTKQISSVMVKQNVPPTDDVAYADYGTGDLEIYTQKGGLIGRIPRQIAKQIGIPVK
jgi:hypothetical protein